MEIPLSKFVAPEFVYGSGSRNLAGQFSVNIGARKVFIVTDRVIVHKNWFGSIIDSLQAEGVTWQIFKDVSVNPRDTECVAGAEAYINSGSDLILAVGGGSVIDCAKGIGVLSANPGPISLYEGVDEIEDPIPPLICIPTTAGSAADISQFAIVTNTKEWYKMAIVSKILVPDLSLIDPDVTLTMGRDLTLDTGLDVLAHAIEAHCSNAASPVTRLHSLEAARLVLTSLPRLATHPEDQECRNRMMMASLQAGLAFSNASLGLVHALAHALGGRFGLIHGELNGILLPAVVRHNEKGAEAPYREIAGLFQQHLNYEPAPLYQHLDRFIDTMRPNRSLESLGVDRHAMETLIPWVLNDPCVVTNPVDVTAEGVMELYERVR